MKIILGSQSLSRKRILEKMGYDFDVLPANIDEKSIRSDDPRKLTLALANAKTDALLGRVSKESILITSDQVVVFDGKIREKPETEKEAADFLFSYAKLPAETVTAVVVFNAANGKRIGAVDTAKIWIRPLPENVIAEYIASGDPYSHSGGFDHEHSILKPYVERIEGDPDSVTGLPRELTENLIKKAQLS